MSLAILLSPFFQDNGGGGGAAIFSLVGACCGLIFAILLIASLWKVFVKAGQPGWAAIVPFYNAYVMQEIVGREIWWLAIFFFLSPIWSIVISLDIAKSFGKDMLYGVGLIVFPYIFYPLLGFGDAKYVGPQRIF
ncbi:MAG: DUF5684 domain-containing protein [Candidatus Promineifilaceae bacterium]